MPNFIRLAYRLGAFALIVGAAANANAWIINFGGTYTNPYTNGEVLTINYANSDLLGNPTTINSVTYSYVPGVSSSGTLSASGPNGNFFADFGGGDIVSGGTHTLNGTWTALPGTIPGQMGTGTYAGSFDGLGDFNFTFVGQPAASPEPASFGALGVGVIGLIIRRRKRS